MDGTIKNVFSIALDWTVEILSPDQSQTKVVKNIMYCLSHDTQMGWLIDPDERTVFVYEPMQAVKIFDRVNQQLAMPKFAEEIDLRLGDLFDWLME